MEAPDKTLLRRCREIFMRYGIKSITMDDLSQKLGISKKTLYQYFEDKHQLIELSFTDFMEEHRLECSQVFSNESNAIDRFVELVTMGTQRLKTINPTVFFDLQKNYHETWKRFHEFKYTFIQNQTVELILQGRNEGLFREDFHVEVASQMHILHMEFLSSAEASNHSGIELGKIISEMTLLFLRSIATEKGTLEIIKHQKTLI